MSAIEWMLALVCVAGTGAEKTPAQLLPADTAILVACDDLAALREAVATLPVSELLASGDHDELADFMKDCFAGAVRGALPGVDAAALAAAPLRGAFVAAAPNDHGTKSVVVGLRWASAEPEGLLPTPASIDDPLQPALRKRSLGAWTLVTQSADLDARVAAVAAGTEPTLADRPRFASSFDALAAPVPGTIEAWLDFDLVVRDPDLPDVDSIDIDAPDFDPARPFGDMRPDLGAAPEAWAAAQRARVAGGRVVSQTLIRTDAPDSSLHVDTPAPIDTDSLRLVPADVSGFALHRWPVARMLAQLGDELSRGPETGELAAVLRELADIFGTSVLVWLQSGGAIQPHATVLVELRETQGAAQNVEFALGAVASTFAPQLDVRTSERPGGRVVHSIAAREPLPIAGELHVTVEGRWLVATTNAASIDAVVARIRGGEAPDVRTNRRFAELFAKLDVDSSPPHGVSFVDPRAAIATGKSAIAAVFTALANQVLEHPVETVVGASLLDAIEAAPASVAITRRSELGWLVERTGCVAGDLSLAWCGLGTAAVTLPAMVAHGATQLLARGRVSKAKADMQMLKAAITSYYAAHSEVPERLGVLFDPDPKNFDESYIDTGVSLRDPWGNEYGYAKVNASTYAIVSLGADGKRGGEGENADITMQP